ncbi:UNVERIFIED_CONTAM: hypothetical protein Slati_0415300 [Sesamum latifolium]|uniref:Uncharacterized protein n=1 Tax=Sesamum latifolium TaxID=2727402 RepID=A0AAW2XVR4_9LAMI
MLLRISRAIIFSNGWGAAIYRKFVHHHYFGEGDALSFIFGGSSNLVLNILKAFLKALKACKPLWRSQQGSPLPPVRWGRRHRNVSFSFFFRDVHVGRSGYTSRDQRRHLLSNYC